MTKVNECYQDPTQKVPAKSPTKFQKLPKFIGKRCLYSSKIKFKPRQRRLAVPDWVELREIIMKKKSLGFY